MAKVERGTEKERRQKNTANRGNPRAERKESKRANRTVKSVETEKDRVEAVETRGEDRCEKETEQETWSGGSGFMPRIDNLDVKSYIRRMCLSVTY